MVLRNICAEAEETGCRGENSHVQIEKCKDKNMERVL